MENFDKEARIVKEGDNADNMMDLDGDIGNILRRCDDILQKIGDALQIEDDGEYEFVVDCNTLCEDIDDEIIILQNFIRNLYGHKLPVVIYFEDHPVSYAHVVKKIGNKTSLSVVDFEGLNLPCSIVENIIESLEFRRLYCDVHVSEEDMLKICWACDTAIQLDSARKKVNGYIENKMADKFAPNLSALVGGLIASKFIVRAGSLGALAKMRPSQVLLLGSKSMVLDNRGGTRRRNVRSVYFVGAHVLRGRSIRLKMRASCLLAEKSVLAAQVDLTRGDPSANTGRSLYDDILVKINEWEVLDPLLVDYSPKEFYKPVEIFDEPNNYDGLLECRKRDDDRRMFIEFSQLYLTGNMVNLI